MAFLSEKLISASAAEETDDDFNLVTGLYHFDGSNGAQNNTYVDSSSTSKTLTCSSNLVQGTFSPFSADEGKWSGSFDGTDDYLSIPTSDDFAFGTGDFTIEMWVFRTTTGMNFTYEGRKGGNANRILIYFNGSNQLVVSAAGTITDSETFPTGEWVHIALVRSGTTGYLFKNGDQRQTWTIASDYSFLKPDDYLYIGTTNYLNNYWFGGFISNLRVLKGTALYTGSSYTVPTAPLTAVTNTKLLIGCSNRFKDKSTSAHVVTTVNGAAIQPFSPFEPSAAYNAAVNGGSANWQIETDKTNKITLSSSADFAFGTGAFTIDCWVYVTADTNPYSRVWHVGPFWNDNNAIGLVVNDTAESDKTTFNVYVAGGRTCVSTNVTPRNEWCHVACVRDSSGNFKLFINGNLDATNTSYTSTDISSGGNQTFAIGNIVETSSTIESEAQFEGYISNLRVVKGTAVYTSSFTPPTAPTTDVTNTKLLANFTNAAAFDQTGKTNSETLGNAQTSTATTAKFGTASLSLDGTSDSFKLINVVPIRTSPFTLEFFFKSNTTSLDTYYRRMYKMATVSTQNNAWCEICINSSSGSYGSGNNIFMYTPGNTIIGTATPFDNNWHHFALTRDTSNNLKMFVDGTQDGSTVTGFTNDLTQTEHLVGSNDTSTGYGDFLGYIDELRLTMKARYTSNFTAPTKEFANR